MDRESRPLVSLKIIQTPAKKTSPLRDFSLAILSCGLFFYGATTMCPALGAEHTFNRKTQRFSLSLSLKCIGYRLETNTQMNKQGNSPVVI